MSDKAAEGSKEEFLSLPPFIPYSQDYETFSDKISRKTCENPLVPFGLLATIGALTIGLYSLKKGDSKLSQRMMRMRVMAQGFTVLAVMGGVYMQATKK
ncbi:hypothetical protein HELRODRAFT_72617 [Helobdella robusta]|uniref:HIG1 domain-containing protein n=1 Tax=Helobdella robusta TaxID=6412 RepID=T1G126_HELRO|nr:hypothetical protein HELRODRAFT_72617 [Helobdella robusta]ESO10887.1 hypothetical protein HELRODRAFT_72617 [Helobdella robusta]